MDLSNDKDPGSIDLSTRESSDSVSASDPLKSCADCRTTKTPLWRAGPNGPKSLCNACGIRYRKKRREAKGVTAAADGGGVMGIKMKVLGLKKKWKRRMLGEEEQAAVLLMALSSGLLYA